MKTPLLILSDAVTAPTGLGRIARDLAIRIHANLSDVFDVGTLGYGGPPQRSLGFPQYMTDMENWVIFNLPEIWQDFAGDQKGIVLTIWDASRMLWFSRPENVANDQLREFLTNAPFKRWGYFPMDATGPNDKLPHSLAHVVEGYDRVLAYSKWAEKILLRSCPKLESITNLPHGIDTSVFKPRNRQAARHGVGERVGVKKQNGSWLSIPDDALMVGIVATNNPRKDFGLAIATVAELARERNVFLWIKTDVLDKHWHILELLYDFGLTKPGSNLITLKPMSDEVLSWMYSACDVTLGIGLGEGFGYPIFESLACGTPCVHVDYAGAAEHLPPSMRVEPSGFRFEGPYTCLRPIFCNNPRNVWVDRIEECLRTYRGTMRPTLATNLNWNNLWPRWEAWLKAGV